MSEIRKPVYIVTAKEGRQRVLKFEIFRKSQWTEKQEDEKLYRLRVNGCWVGGTHGDMFFYAADEILELLYARLKKEGLR